MAVNEVKPLADQIRAEVAKAVVGQDDTVDLLLTALFAGGHILLEAPPGTAKTLLARSFGMAVGLDYGRIQFTPDLMPGDIIGSNLFNFQTSSFTLTQGPIFCELLLADELNRTPPKTQAALLEAMQERRVTLDGQTHELGERFMVVATQNPIEQQGTYPLPEAQLDRFLFKHLLDYPDEAQERDIVARHGIGRGSLDPAGMGVQRVADGAAIDAAVTAGESVRLTDEVIHYVTALVRATRSSSDIGVGASPRAGAMLARAARARAALDGRDYVIPDDVKTLALPVLRHRLVLSPSAEIEGRHIEQVLGTLVEQVAAPR